MHIWIKVSTKNCFCYFKNVCINFESSEPRLMGVENITPIHLSITLRPTITHITLPPTLLSIALRTTQFLTIIRSFDNYESCKKRKVFLTTTTKIFFVTVQIFTWKSDGLSRIYWTAPSVSMGAFGYCVKCNKSYGNKDFLKEKIVFSILLILD